MRTIYKKQRKNIKTQTGDSSYTYQNELDKACFQHDMAFGDFKDLTRRTDSNKILRVKQLVLLKILNIMDINADLLQWSINFMIKNFCYACTARDLSYVK